MRILITWCIDIAHVNAEALRGNKTFKKKQSIVFMKKTVER